MTDANEAIDLRLLALGLGAPEPATQQTAAAPVAPEPPVPEAARPEPVPAAYAAAAGRTVAAPPPAPSVAQPVNAPPAPRTVEPATAQPAPWIVQPASSPPAPRIVQPAPAPPAPRIAKPAPATPAARAAKVTPAPEPIFPERTNGITVEVFMGFPARPAVLTFDVFGVHVTGKEPFGVPWTAVTDVREQRGHVVIKTAKRRVALAVAIDGITEPALAAPLARLLAEARGGTQDRSGSAALDFRNASDRLHDEFADEDDVFTPAMVAVVFLACAAAGVMLVPHLLALGTAPAVPSGIFVLDSRLSPFDPRSLATGLAAAAMLSSLILRVAGGKHTLAWARGTLRGWHKDRPAALMARRLLAMIVHRPAISAAVLLLGAALALPSARTVVVFDGSGVRVVRELPFLDDERSWRAVADISAIPAPLDRHPSGVAVVVRFDDGASFTTLGHYLHGGTDKQFFDVARTWRDAAAGSGRN